MTAKGNYESAKREIEARFQSKTVIPTKVAKEVMQEIYNNNGFSQRKAKSTDLTAWGVNYRDAFARDSRTGKMVRMIKIL